MLAVLLLGTSGCAGGNVRATSWTGATLVEGTLYVADLEQVVALNAADGTEVWTFPEDPEEDRLGVFYVAPAVDEAHVIVASQAPPAGLFSQPRHVVWGLDRETGAELWSFDQAASQYVEGGAIGDGIFVIGNSDNDVYALDVESGARRWGAPFETGHRVWATPLIVDDIVYVGSMDRHLYALDLASGRELWKFSTQGAFADTPVLRDGVLYAGAFDNRLYAIDAQTGTELWRLEGENWFWGSPVLYDDVVYAADVDGNIYAVDAETGSPIWNESIDEPVRAGMAVTEDGGRLFVGSQDGTLYALDTNDGYVMWSQDSEGQVLSRPIVDESVVYELVLYESYRLRALHVENGREVWTYPQDAEE
jgi:outer membrane protein assembly factor BamB